MESAATLSYNSESSPRMPRLLLLEPEAALAERVLRELREAGIDGFRRVVETASELEAALQSGEYDAVLLDCELRKGQYPEEIQVLRQFANETPFVLLTELPEEAVAAESIKWGASDYVLKERLTRLPFAVRRALDQHELLQESARMRAALIENETRAHTLIENATYGIFRVDLNGKFQSANEMLLKILAYSDYSEIQPLNLASDVFRYTGCFRALVNNCRETGMMHNVETEWRRRDGGFVAVRLHLRYITDGRAGEGIEGIVEDVTEVRALERQLRQAQKSETIGQLAGGIAHDFNNVLGAVIGWAEIGYEQSREYSRIAEYFAHIRQQADRAANLTRELLTFARRQPMRPRPVQLNDIIQSLMSFLDKVIGKDIEIKVLPGPLRFVKAEPAQIEQVLMNLCLNARDAMPGGGLLRIQTEMLLLDDTFCHFHPGVAAGTYAMLSISDTGIGMSPEVREHIFEPFFTTKERGKGSGMGLATVYGIVRQHGGFIHVYSEPGQGTLFNVFLPAMENVPPEGSGETTRLSETKSLRGSETILFAEDHDSIRELVWQSLTHLGYRVLAAADGREALRLAALHRPAMAVLDVVMPYMGGAATASELLRRFPGMPILFTTGFSENADNAMAQVPASHYLQKPYSPTSLACAIREILDHP